MAVTVQTGEPEVDVPPALRSSELHREFIQRFGQGRDMRVIVSADNASTGVGKTTLAVFLAKLWDVWGWSPEKATLDPREFSVFYDQVRPGSVMLLDEAEQALDRRRSMSEEVLNVSHDFATKRYRQIFGILTLPSKDLIDARIADKLCDYWVLVEEPGKASVFEFDENQFTNQVYYKKRETLEWPPLDDDPDFQAVEQKKIDRMTGKTQSRYVHRDEVEELKENFWRKATAERTYEVVRAAHEASQDDSTDVSLTQSDIGRIAGLSQPRVSEIVNADDFGEVYSSLKDADTVETAG